MLTATSFLVIIVLAVALASCVLAYPSVFDLEIVTRAAAQRTLYGAPPPYAFSAAIELVPARSRTALASLPMPSTKLMETVSPKSRSIAVWTSSRICRENEL